MGFFSKVKEVLKNTDETFDLKDIKTKNETIELSVLESRLPFPFLTICNSAIVTISSEFSGKLSNYLERPIEALIPQYKSNLPIQNVFILDKVYTTIAKDYTKTIDGIVEHYTNIYFIEMFISDSKALGSENISVWIILVDNYDEVLNTVEEIRRPLLLALIDRKLNTLAQQVSGIVKSFEKDKYLMLMTNDKLEYIKLRKFEILQQIREIDFGNKFPVTLSIGIGVNGSTLAKSMEYARAAIDLALGRGGDQVLIKDSEKYFFFGGITKEISSSTRVKARVKAYAFAELIEESSNVVIIGHRNLDLDCIGAALGVYKIVDTYSKPCKFVLGEITSNIRHLYNRILEETQYKSDIFISKDQISEYINPNTLIVVVDAHRPSILEVSSVLTDGVTKKIVVIDHHRKGAEFIDNAVLTYHEPYASSTCELITEMIEYCKKEISFRPVEADALLAGITVDTKNFLVKTGAKTFEAAAYLRRKGADSIRVRLMFQNDILSFKAKAETVNNAEIYKGNIAISSCPDNVENPSLLAAQASDELLNISGIKASFVLATQGDKVFISARSIDDFNVQYLMEKLGGGGHQTVAGAQFDNITEDEVLIMLKDVINKY